jgi:phosphatidylglycerol---prolipoprotein diacylglyceryl transferase
MYFTWNGSPDIVSIGPITLRWYGVLFAAGFMIAASITARMFQRERQNLASLDTLVGYMIAGTILGARLGHTLIYEPEIYLADPIRILKVWEGGLASHGGTLGAMLAAWIWNRKFRKGSYLSLIDWISYPTALVCTMIRLGNFFNSEILGRPTDVPWAVIFQRVDQLPRHPAMLYESASYFCIFWLMRWMWNRKLHLQEGLMFGTFVTLLFGSRFVIEFFKELQVDSEVGLTLDYGQLLSIPFIIAGLILVVRSFKLGSKLNR